MAMSKPNAQHDAATIDLALAFVIVTVDETEQPTRADKKLRKRCKKLLKDRDKTNDRKI
jgi:hypothetical protein